MHVIVQSTYTKALSRLNLNDCLESGSLNNLHHIKASDSVNEH